MNKAQSNEKDKKLTDVLNRLTRRIEEATVDIHEMKRDLKFVNLRLHTVEKNTEITKIDVEKIRQNVDDLIETSSEILSKMVTQKEFDNLSRRVSSLEHTAKTS
ncbi:MAG: hypothetical protein HY431_01645 [Candidatus Levybacteria bacterium]|nr:hypothetical protein [Candidatus Levybacteria bacterium]